MSSPPTINRFKGTGWEECNEFILAIRAVAWKEGKIRDPGWIADFASLHFSHKALSWHSRLPKDVRQDWEKLEVALLDTWASPEEDDEPPIKPTPAAAGSPNRNYRAENLLQGVLKVVIDGSNADFYIKLRHDGLGVATNDANEALRVRCSSLSNTTLLALNAGSRHSWLGVQWRITNPDLTNGCTTYGYLVFVDALTLKTSWGVKHPYQVAECTVSADREVIPFRENDDTKLRIGIFTLGDLLYLAADPSAYSQSCPDEKRVKIFIQPTD